MTTNRPKLLELACDVSSLAADCTIAAENCKRRDHKLQWIGMRTELKRVQNRVLSFANVEDDEHGGVIEEVETPKPFGAS